MFMAVCMMTGAVSRAAVAANAGTATVEATGATITTAAGTSMAEAMGSSISNATSTAITTATTTDTVTTTTRAIQPGTGGINDPTEHEGGYNGKYFLPSDYIYFGTNNNEPIKWRVLDADLTNDSETRGMFLLSEYILENDIAFEATLSDDGDGQIKPNEWQNSDAQNWCRTFEADTEKFSTIEQGTFLGVEKADEIWYPPFLGISQCGEGIITKQDKVFFLSLRELANYVGNESGLPELVATDIGQNVDIWWLRSSHGEEGYVSNAGRVTTDGELRFGGTSYEHSTRPAFNLNQESVLFTSAARGGKIPATDEDTQGQVDSFGIFEIPTTTRSEWKVTLFDENRRFSVVQTGAEVGETEYLSVVIEDSVGASHYGRIMKPVSEEGQVSITIPDTLQTAYIR